MCKNTDDNYDNDTADTDDNDDSDIADTHDNNDDNFSNFFYNLYTRIQSRHWYWKQYCHYVYIIQCHSF